MSFPANIRQTHSAACPDKKGQSDYGCSVTLGSIKDDPKSSEVPVSKTENARPDEDTASDAQHRESSPRTLVDISDEYDGSDDSDRPRSIRTSTRKRKASQKLIESFESQPDKHEWDPPAFSTRMQSAPLLQSSQIKESLARQKLGIANSEWRLRLSKSNHSTRIGGSSEGRPTPAGSSPQAPQSKTKPRYFVATSRNGLLDKDYWGCGSLGDKSLADVFENVTALTSKGNIEEIEFALVSRLPSGRSQSIKYSIRKRDVELYEEMKEVFRATIKSDKKVGFRTFDVLAVVRLERSDDRVHAVADIDGEGNDEDVVL